MGQYVAPLMMKALVLHLFNGYEVKLAVKQEIRVDKSGCTPKAGRFLKLTSKSIDYNFSRT
jgi:hypothetical protein